MFLCRWLSLRGNVTRAAFGYGPQQSAEAFNRWTTEHRLLVCDGGLTTCWTEQFCVWRDLWTWIVASSRRRTFVSLPQTLLAQNSHDITHSGYIRVLRW
jgi:hypothetical protein